MRNQGADKLRQMLNNAPSLLEATMMQLWYASESTTLGKRQMVEQMLPYLTRVSHETEKGLLIRKLSQLMDTEETWIWKELAQFRTGDRRPMAAPLSQKNPSWQGTPMERHLLKIVLRTDLKQSPRLIEALEEDDFADGHLKVIWKVMRETYFKKGRLDLAFVLESLEEDSYRQWLEAMAIEEMPIENEEQTILDCLQHIKQQRLRRRMKSLKQELAKAEQEHDDKLVHQLMHEQNGLMKQIRSPQHEKGSQRS